MMSNIYRGKLSFVIFWENNNCPKKFKLQTFDAVIRSKLVYSLDSIMIPKASKDFKKLWPIDCVKS